MGEKLKYVEINERPQQQIIIQFDQHGFAMPIPPAADSEDVAYRLRELADRITQMTVEAGE